MASGSATSSRANQMLRLQSLGLAFPKESMDASSKSSVTEYFSSSSCQTEIPVENNASLRVDIAEDMLQISAGRDQVIYSTSCGQHVHVSIKPPAHYGPILKAVFTTFKKHGKNLCILQPEHVLIHSMQGSSFTVALPYKANNMHAIPGGLLIQRETPIDIVEDANGPTIAASGMRGKTSPIASREKADTMQGTGSVILESSASPAQLFDGSYNSDIDASPTLFSLLHPLDEPRPVVLPDGNFFTDRNVNIFFSSTKDAFLITHNTDKINQEHNTTIWKIEREMEKLHDFLKMDDGIKTSPGMKGIEPPSPILNVSSSTPSHFSNPLKTSPIVNDSSFATSPVAEKITVESQSLDETEDDIPSIEAEVILNPIWSTPSVKDIKSVYLFQDDHVCFQSDQKLFVYKGYIPQATSGDNTQKENDVPLLLAAKAKTLKLDFTIGCMSSVPIHCHDLACILTLPVQRSAENADTSTVLHLYHGKTPLCTCIAPRLGGRINNDSMADISSSNAVASGVSRARANNFGHENLDEIFEVKAILGGANDRANIVLANNLVYRVQVPFFIRCGLTQKCFSFLSAVLPPSLCLKLKTEIILSSSANQFDRLKQILEEIFILYQRKKTGKEHRNSQLDRAPGGEGSLQADDNKNLENEENIDSATRAEKQIAWNTMMGSNFHLTYDNSHKATLRCFTKEISKKGAKRMRDSPTKESHLPSSLRSANENMANFLRSLDAADTPRLIFSVEECLPFVQPIFYALHLAYEDLKLSTLTWPNLERMESILTRIASIVSLVSYQKYYLRDTGINDICMPKSKNADLPDNSDAHSLEPPPVDYEYLVTANPPDFYGWLTRVFRHGLGGSKECCRDVEMFPTLLKSSLTYKLSTVYMALHHGGTSGNQLAMMEMVRLGVTLAVLETLPLGLSLPLQEAAAQCREDPPEGWPSEAYELIGRSDLMNFESQLSRAAFHASTSRHPLKDDSDGIELLQRLTRLRFGRDRRVKEVCRLLRSSKANRLVVERGPEVSDHDLIQAQQKRLEQLCRRTLALPVGRGMLTYSSISPQLTDQMPIPEVSLAGRIPPHNGTILLDTSALHLSESYTNWVSFHNGVAAGLRISSNSKHGVDDGLTRTWIIYNKPKGKPTHEHAGFLMALGLQGHLMKLKLTDIYGYLSQGHDATTVAILLGQAAAYRGTLDLTISKMLCLHIPSLLPQTIAEMDVPAPVQASAILGVGLLYQGSCHRLMTEFLLEEIGRRPLNDRYADRESYALSAGISLGFVTLGAGINAEKRRGLSDLHIEDRLHLYMVGGEDPSLRGGAYQTKFGRTSNVDSSGEIKCSRIFEGNAINVGVTSPGATVALGLMYIRSNNDAVAQRVAIPDTHFLLDYIRPDFLMLREICFNLIMWDNVKASEDWLKEQVPPVVHTSMEMIESARDQNHSFDVMGIKQAHAYVVTGACFSIGLKYAGTAHKGAVDLLTAKVCYFKMLREKSSHWHRPDRCTLETCLGTCALALAMVMAGTGELKTLRLFRELRMAPVDEEITYGNHMAVGMAIGLLFLSGGQATLGRSNTSIAALVCSLYPRFPLTSEDNQYHLQPLRHLYVLAVENRVIEAFDAETLESCYAPLQIELKDGTVINKITPCLVPEHNLISRISSTSPRYWPVTCSGERLRAVLAHRGLLLKRRTGHLSYENDPLGQRSVLARGYPKRVGSRLSIREFCAGFTEDPVLLKYAELVLGSETQFSVGDEDDNIQDENNKRSSVSDGVSLLYRCMTSSGDHMMLRNTLILMHTVHMLPWFTDTMALQNLYLVFAYYDDALSDNNANAILQRDFLEGIRTRVHEYLSTASSIQSSLVTSEAMQSRATLHAHGISLPEDVLKRLLHEI